jgi:hypothetical protein
LHGSLGDLREVFADVIRNPTFPSAEFEREKQNQLANLAQQNNNPNAVAGRVRAILAFGREHPYGRPGQGLPSTVGSITREDVARFWQERAKPGSSTLVFVGGVSLDEAAKLAEKHFGTWAGGNAHDRNNVLTPFLLSISLLRRDEQDQKRMRTLSIIDASAKRGAEMVKQVLSFARGVEGERLPVQIPALLRGMPVLQGATFGWGVETGGHALRILFSGVFDRFPGLKLVLGHMGEFLPFMRWRLDSRFAAYPHGLTLEKPPSAYFQSNIFITTSGVCSAPTLVGAIGELRPHNVLFSIDYPYESTTVAC